MSTSQELLARVDELLPAIAASADAGDRDGQLPDAIIAALTDAGLFGLLAPKEYGGHELDFETFSRVVQKISAAQPSAGWVGAFLMGASWRLLILGREGQKQVFGDKGFVLGAGAAAPITGVTKVDGGYRLSGRTGWNSGSSHAEWFQVNGILNAAAGAPQVLMFVVNREAVQIVDSWHILGMKATASRDLVFDDVFVPDHMAALFGPALEGNSAGHRLHANPMYHIPFLPFAMLEVLPVVVGMHRGAANALRDRVQGRMGTLSGARAAERAPAQIRMAQGLARAQMAEQMLAAMVAEISAGGSHAADPKHRAEIKLRASMVTTFCLDSVNEMARSVGGDSFRDEAPFQRFFRDINTLARHAFLDPDTAAESYGRLELGLPVNDPMI
ncbi:MAG: acyl-CoA dehydrogenase family protein [Pseudomonadota bacterium]